MMVIDFGAVICSKRYTWWVKPLSESYTHDTRGAPLTGRVGGRFLPRLAAWRRRSTLLRIERVWAADQG
jgi:hypothetical protein